MSIFKASLTQLAEFLSFTIDMIGNVKVNSSGGSDETVKRPPFDTKVIIRAISYLNPNGKVVFTQLRNVFIKTLIFCPFDLEFDIQIETDVSGNTISKVFGQLTLDNLV